MKKRMLADVLWDAANVRLWDGVGHYPMFDQSPTTYSCNAIAHVLKFDDCDSLPTEISEWIGSLGCNLQSTALQFSFATCVERQGVRYMWLLLAMHVAEDEGIEA